MHLFHKTALESIQTLNAGDIVSWSGADLVHTTGFSQNANIFMCPLTGVYEFYVQIRARQFTGDLLMESASETVVLLHLHGEQASRRSNTAGSVIARCELNSQVYVKTTRTSNVVVQRSAFTGKILYYL